MARAIRTVLEARALTCRLGAEGRARVEAEFRADAIVASAGDAVRLVHHP